MASESTTADPGQSVSPVVGLGLAVMITLAAGIAIGFLAIVIVG